MKKLFIVSIILLLSANCAYSSCVVTGGACAIEDIRQNSKKNSFKKESKKEKIHKQKTNIKTNIKKEYGKK